MSETKSLGLDNSPRLSRIIQAVVDLRRGDLRGADVLDLGCAHGLYALEFARRGANSLGLEGRAEWIRQAEAHRDGLGLSSARFIREDVRRADANTYGKFDVVLCLGLLYHLDAQEALDLLRNLYDMTKDLIVIDTQVALEPSERREMRGQTYFGRTFPEHAVGTSSEDMEAVLGASLDSNFSFWFTLPSLTTMLGDVGFSTVFELKWPTDHMYLDGELKVHEDYVTLVAIKGAPVSDVVGVAPRQRPLERSPEHPSQHILQRPWSKPMTPLVEEAAGVGPPAEGALTERSGLAARLAAAARVLRGH